MNQGVKMGKQIKELRKYFSRELLASRFGVSTKTIDRWEKNQTGVLRIGDQRRIHRMAENLRNKLEDKS